MSYEGSKKKRHEFQDALRNMVQPSGMGRARLSVRLPILARRRPTRGRLNLPPVSSRVPIPPRCTGRRHWLVVRVLLRVQCAQARHGARRFGPKVSRLCRDTQPAISYAFGTAVTRLCLPGGLHCQPGSRPQFHADINTALYSPHHMLRSGLLEGRQATSDRQRPSRRSPSSSAMLAI